MLTTNTRTHILILTDNREIPLTTKQYVSLKNEQKIGSYNDPITISDPDTGKIMFDGKISAIKEYREIEKKNLDGLGYYCDFGIFHGVNDSCEHHIEFDISPYVFQQKVFAQFPQVRYNRDITHSMRTMILGK